MKVKKTVLTLSLAVGLCFSASLSFAGTDKKVDSADSAIGPLSSPGCGILNNKAILKQYDDSTSRWVYLVQANF